MSPARRPRSTKGSSGRPSGPEASEPVRNVSVTAVCGVCGDRLPAGRARRWCSDACRQAAFRVRRAAPAPVPAQPAKADMVYECVRHEREGGVM